MPTIMIKTARAHSIYHSMIEGMLEIAADDDDSNLAQRLDNLIYQTPDTDGAVYPLTFDIDAELLGDATDAFENCEIDNDDDDSLHDGDVVITSDKA